MRRFVVEILFVVPLTSGYDKAEFRSVGFALSEYHALPYTLLIAPGGKVLYRQQGEIDPLAVRRQIVEVLGRTYANRGKYERRTDVTVPSAIRAR